MNNQTNKVANHKDPWVILGVSMDADEKQIRSAYIQKVKDFPPDRDPEQFERIRDAYELLRDPARRVKSMIIAVDPQADLVTLLNNGANNRRWVGPDPWLKVLNER